MVENNSFIKLKKKEFIQFLNEFSKGILVPVFTLPIVGIILALGILLSNPTLPMGKVPTLFALGKIITDSLISIFINLSPLFCVGIAAGMAKKKRGEAGLNSLILFFVFIYAMNSYMTLNKLLISGPLSGTGQSMVLGVQVLDMGVFLGMLIGVISVKLHNKFVDVEFEGAMRLYGGVYLGMLIGLPIIIFLAMIFVHIWPIVQIGIGKITGFIFSSGALGVGVYGFLERILIPTGLHHLLWVPVEFSALSGTGVVDGKVLEGVRNIATAELSSPNVDKLSHGAVYLTKAMSKMFGLVGAGFAMYKCANRENKDVVKALLIPAVIASVLPGITEPLEFSFLFTAPILFIAHSVLAGLGMAAVAFFDIKVIAVSGGLEFLAMMLPALGKTDTFKFILVGTVQLVVYYYTFKFLIQKLDLKTPGREKDKSADEIKLYSKADYKAKDIKIPSHKEEKDELARLVIDGLGGKENIVEVGNCFSRLRITLKDNNLIDENILSQTKNGGIVRVENGVQIIFGLHVQKVRSAIDRELGTIIE